MKVNRPSTVTRFTELGNNVNFNGIRISGRGPVKIGNNFHSGRDCVILTSSHDYDSGEAIPYGSATIDRPVIIEDNVWIGERVIILGGAHLKEGSIIQAGSLVVGTIPECAIAGGHPARQFKERDKHLYQKLKSEGKFN